MKKTLLAIWRIVKNKYVAATLIFLLFELRKDASIIEKDIQQDSIAAVSLYGNPDAIETYGRENYYMKRENEDIFIIKD